MYANENISKIDQTEMYTVLGNKEDGGTYQTLTHKNEVIYNNTNTCMWDHHLSFHCLISIRIKLLRHFGYIPVKQCIVEYQKNNKDKSFISAQDFFRISGYRTHIARQSLIKNLSVCPHGDIHI